MYNQHHILHYLPGGQYYAYSHAEPATCAHAVCSNILFAASIGRWLVAWCNMRKCITTEGMCTGTNKNSLYVVLSRFPTNITHMCLMINTLQLSIWTY